MTKQKIIIEIEDGVAAVIFEGSKLTYRIADFCDKTGKFIVHNEVNKDVINIVADILLAFGYSINHSLKANLT